LQNAIVVKALKRSYGFSMTEFTSVLDLSVFVSFLPRAMVLAITIGLIDLTDQRLKQTRKKEQKDNPIHSQTSS
jgi:hypothetical protein